MWKYARFAEVSCFQTTDLFSIDGETGVNFNHGTSITYGQNTNKPNIGIQSNAGTIAFSGAPFTFDYKPQGKTQLWAGDSIPVPQKPR